jgi:hypothetical protein
MTLIRAAFIFALLTPVLGVLGSRYLIARLVYQAPQVALAPAPPSPRPTHAAPTATATVLPTETPTALPKSTPTTAPATAIPASPMPTVTAVRPAPSKHRTTVAVRHAHRAKPNHRRPVAAVHRLTAKVRPRRKAVARVRPSPTVGIVTLTRYWISATRARRGTTIGVGYVIDNATGRTNAIMLGASIKSVNTLSWLEAINDTSHDVVATVPPGETTHSRYFTLPRTLRPGWYDVAWGLRDAATGARDAVVAADAVLRVTR